MEPAIFVRYSTPSGDPLIYKAPDPVFMPNLPGWGFHLFNPVRERFDEVIQSTIQAGLVDFWKLRTWYRMKRESRERGEEALKPNERPISSPLNMDDLQGVFFLAILVMLVAFATFLLEFTSDACRRKCGRQPEDFMTPVLRPPAA